MKKATVTLKSTSPYEQSKHYEVPKFDKESAKDYEARTWRNRMHTDDNGDVFIPPIALKNCLSEAAKYLSIQIPGKGKATYTKHFEAGIMVLEPILLGIKADDVKGVWIFVPSDGKRGGGKRVEKCFPVMPRWEATATIYVLDETITEDVFIQHLTEAGKFIGMGAFRPRNNGYFGRFEIVGKIKWEDA